MASSEVSKNIKFLNPGNIDAWRGPYATVTAACTAIQNTTISVDGVSRNLREGKFVEIGTAGAYKTFWWSGGYADANLVEYLDISTQSSVSNILSATDNSISTNVFSAINNVPSLYSGVLNVLTGVFTGAGECKIAILANRKLVSGVVYSFDIVGFYSFQVPGGSNQTIDVSSLMIPIESGQYIGFLKSSTALPRYGAGADKGYGWYRLDADITEGALFYLQAAVGFKINFTVKVFKYLPTELSVTKAQNTLLLKNKANLADVPVLAGYTPTKNLFDKTSSANVTGKYPSPGDGSLVTNALYVTSGYLKFKQGDVITQNKGISVAFYNENKVFVSGISSPKTYTFPAGATYMLTGVLKTDLDVFQIEISPVATAYIPFGVENSRQILVADNFKGVDVKDYMGLTKSLNLFKESEATDNRYVSVGDGTLVLNVNYKASGFIPFSADTDGIQTFALSTVFYDASQVYISGVTTANWKSPLGTAYVRTSVLKTALDSFMLVKGTTLPNSYISGEAISLPNLKVNSSDVIDSYKVNTIIATRNANDYNSIRDIIKGITDATSLNRYVVFVPNGVWFEVDIQGKPWVDIKLENREKAILFCDGNSTDPKHVTPADYVYPAQANKQISTVETSFLHTIFVTKNMVIENGSVHHIRGKYPIHIDNSGFQEYSGRNLHIIAEDCTNPVGIGTWGGQKIALSKSIFEVRNPGAISRFGLFIHNSTNQTKPAHVLVEDSKFIGCGYALIDELGSNQVDLFELINCETDSVGEIQYMVDGSGTPTVSYWINPATGVREPDPKKVPYCIHVNTSGTKVDAVTIRSAESFAAPFNTGNQRPKALDYLISDYYGVCNIPAAEVIKAGDILCLGNPLGVTHEGSFITAAKFTSMTGNLVLGVALEDNQLDELNPVAGTKIKYAPVGKFAETFVNGAIGSGSLNKKLVWDDVNKYLKVSATANIRDVFAYSLRSKIAGTPTALVKIL